MESPFDSGWTDQKLYTMDDPIFVIIIFGGGVLLGAHLAIQWVKTRVEETADSGRRWNIRGKSYVIKSAKYLGR